MPHFGFCNWFKCHLSVICDGTWKEQRRGPVHRRGLLWIWQDPQKHLSVTYADNLDILGCNLQGLVLRK